jgi:hypothetical protein
MLSDGTHECGENERLVDRDQRVRLIVRNLFARRRFGT